MNGVINIKGQIGSSMDESGNITERGVELVDVIVQAQAIPADAKRVDIYIASPGGYVSVGDQISAYIASLKAKFPIVATWQSGPIGSIATKIFLEGNERFINPSFDFFIHNPWTNPGAVDAPKAASLLLALQAEKERLLAYYQEKTGKTKEDLEPLMDLETGLNADQAMALGFATHKIEAEVAFEAFASIKTNMNTKKSALQELLDGIKALLSTPVAPPAKASVNLTLADDSVAVSDAADEASLVGSGLNVNGQPAPDGEHKLKDGRSIVVSGGKITEIKQAAAPAIPAEALARVEAIENNLKSLAESVKMLAQAKVSDKKAFEDSLTEIKAQITHPGQPPKTSKTATDGDYRPGSFFDKRREEIKNQNKK